MIIFEALEDKQTTISLANRSVGIQVCLLRPATPPIHVPSRSKSPVIYSSFKLDKSNRSSNNWHTLAAFVNSVLMTFGLISALEDVNNICTTYFESPRRSTPRPASIRPAALLPASLRLVLPRLALLRLARGDVVADGCAENGGGSMRCREILECCRPGNRNQPFWTILRRHEQIESYVKRIEKHDIRLTSG